MIRLLKAMKKERYVLNNKNPPLGATVNSNEFAGPKMHKNISKKVSKATPYQFKGLMDFLKMGCFLKMECII